MTQASHAQFALDLSAFCAKAKNRADQVARKIVLDIGTRVIQRSPVGDDSYWKHPAAPGYVGGHFRANWQYGEAVAPRGVVPGADPTGSAAIQRLLAGLRSDASGRVHFLANNLPYAQRLEYGWSRQAPSGMVGVTVAEFQAIVSRAAKDGS